MTNKEVSHKKVRIYTAIIGLVIAANILLNALVVFLNYPTQAHRSVARQMEALNAQMFNGADFTQIMESEEYKKLAESPEAHYTNLATFYTLVLSFLGTIAIVGAVYYYLRKRRLANNPTWATVLLVSAGGLLPFVFMAYGAAMFIGSPTPGMGHVLFMLFIGLIIAPLVNAVIAKLFDWHYNRKNSLVIE